MHDRARCGDGTLRAHVRPGLRRTTAATERDRVLETTGADVFAIAAGDPLSAGTRSDRSDHRRPRRLERPGRDVERPVRGRGLVPGHERGRGVRGRRPRLREELDPLDPAQPRVSARSLRRSHARAGAARRHRVLRPTRRRPRPVLARRRRPARQRLACLADAGLSRLSATPPTTRAASGRPSPHAAAVVDGAVRRGLRRADRGRLRAPRAPRRACRWAR